MAINTAYVTITSLNSGVIKALLVRRDTVKAGIHAHTDSGAITLMTINYAAAIITLALMHAQTSLARVAFVAVLFTVNLFSLSEVHLLLVAKPGVKSLVLFLINTIPYSVLLINPQPWLVIPAISLAIFIFNILRRKGRSAAANISGTLLIASTYLPWYFMAGGYVTTRILTAYTVWIIYHLFTSLYVEGKLPFRRSFKPWHSSIPWLAAMPAMAYAMLTTSNAVMLIVLLEPTIRSILALREGKLGMDNLRHRIRKIGIFLVIESIIIISLLLLYTVY